MVLQSSQNTSHILDKVLKCQEFPQDCVIIMGRVLSCKRVPLVFRALETFHDRRRSRTDADPSLPKIIYRSHSPRPDLGHHPTSHSPAPLTEFQVLLNTRRAKAAICCDVYDKPLKEPTTDGQILPRPKLARLSLCPTKNKAAIINGRAIAQTARLKICLLPIVRSITSPLCSCSCFSLSHTSYDTSRFAYLHARLFLPHVGITQRRW
jgi:hypothetical protein